MQKAPPGVTGQKHPEPLLLTIDEAADALGIGRSSVYKLLAAKQLDSVKIHRSNRITRRSVERLAGVAA